MVITRFREWLTLLMISAGLVASPSQTAFDLPAVAAPAREMPVSRSSVTVLGSPAYALDQTACEPVYILCYWNSGHYAPAAVTLDLGTTRSLARGSFAADATPRGKVAWYVSVSSDNENYTIVATGTTYAVAPLGSDVSFSFPPGTSGKYVRIGSADNWNGSWVALGKTIIFSY